MPVETPVVVAATPAVVASAIVALASPSGIALVVVAAASVAVGVMTKRALAAARGKRMPPWGVEVALWPVEIVIAMVAMQGLGLSGLAAIAMGITVGHAGAPFVETWLRSNEPQMPVATVLPPNDPAPEIYQALAKVEQADAANHQDKGEAA